MGVDAVVIPFQTSTEFLSPIKLYESLALGLPIIATPMPALVELSKTIKSLVVAADCTPKSLAKCIQTLFSDKDRLCITKEIARNRYEVYTWSTRAKMILNHISDKLE
jgi:glycosyltransferase involved in cell wall biosynthesis